ncbi:PDR/VanB family oxidoreductase [Streptomyces brasiliensis]|uniref:Ferredoxin n=1 Tax=Streptomyces brasiliensis TaxID=1954 RepID=A0A917NXU6_9ACTN|nr:PDR/VanB family oxidoreductase [Streptomyces brasiliensis]GGJ39767.1 ferredoxin [Streptomyces brasiliensis]
MTTSPDNQELHLHVEQIRWEADDVVSLQLSRRDDAELPPWQPGAHLEVRLPSGLTRQYSLCGHPEDRRSYTIAVLRAQPGRGGSAEIHDTALIGRQLRVRGPRNQFPLQPAPSYVFIAGGIGITPILSMARDATSRRLPWSLHYGGRSARSMAFTRDITDLAQAAGAPVTVLPEDRHGLLPLKDIVESAGTGAAVYGCGPSGMLAALRDSVTHRPDVSLHTELFTAPAPETGDVSDTPPDQHDREFTVVLARTGETVQVTDGTTILEAVRRLRPEVAYSCEEGFCGTCDTKVLDGTPVHRDTVLTEAECDSNTSMMICVGSCASGELVLDL